MGNLKAKMASMEEPVREGDFVSNILRKSNNSEGFMLDESIQRVLKRSTDLKLEVAGFLKQYYHEFLPMADVSLSLENRARDVMTDVQRLSTLIEDNLGSQRLSDSANKRQEGEGRLTEVTIMIGFIESLLEIHKQLIKGREEHTNGNYLKGAELVRGMEELMDDIRGLGCEAVVYHSLKEELILLKSDIIYSLYEDWNKAVTWTTVSSSSRDVTLFSHTVPSESCKDFERLVVALLTVLEEGEWKVRVINYSRKLLDNILKPLLSNGALRLEAQLEGDNKIKMSLIEDSDPVSVEEKLCDVITVMTTVTQMIPETHRSNWSGKIGKEIEPELYLLVQSLLSQSSPKTAEERVNYSTISEAVLQLEESLTSLGVVKSDYTSLSDYTRNVDIHIVTQQCQDILSHARSLLTRPLHETTLVGVADTAEMLKGLELSQKLVIDSIQPEDSQQARVKSMNIESLTFTFPSCLISSSTKELVSLLYETLSKCSSSSLSLSMRMYRTARDLVDLFIAVSQSYLLEVEADTLVPVLKHNNYMYVSHHLLTLGHQFGPSLPKGVHVTFVDVIPQLRRLAENCFLAEMESQSDTLSSFFKSAPSFEDIGSDPVKQESLTVTVSKSLNHIVNLSKRYSGALPKELHKRCKYGLLNELVSELIGRSLAVEDLSVEDSNFLYTFLTLDVLEKASAALVGEGEDGPELCPNWEKLKELVFVLKAEQEDIVSRWDKGEGPLAKRMSVSEVKHLIRASFKNTSRRADTLSKIT